jgi:anti-sigma factor RsiW
MEDEILKQALAPGPDCLPLEELGRYVDGTLSAQQHNAAARHIERCLTCQAELALMQSMTSVRERDGSKKIRVLPLAVAAAVVAVVAAGSSYVLLRKPPELPPSVTTEPDVTRSLTLGVRSPVGDQREAPRRLEWVASDRAVRYRVRLLEVDRRELWSTTTTAPAAEVPSTVQSSLTPGRTFLWDVTAYDAADRVVSESGLQSFKVLPR